MTTLRDGNPLTLMCLVAISLGQLTIANGEILQTGRRRSTAQQQEQTAARSRRQMQPARDPKASGERSASTTAGDRSQPRQADPLLLLAERAINKTSLRRLDAEQHTPWQIMHGVVALRKDFELTQGGETVNCVEFVSDAPMFRGEQWWQVTEHGGRPHPFSVPYAFEGHPNQFLALLSMSNLPLTHEFNVDGTHTVTMADMIHNAKMTVNSKKEITWTLWFLTHYIDIDSEWTNADGEAWSMEKLVRIQTQAKVTTASCGGCHGLFAIAYARNAYLQKHGRLRGVYHQADQKIKQYVELARSLQNQDGSFSSEFYKGPGQSRDFNERIKASGHLLEWLMMALPQGRLREAWIRRAVASISTDLIHNASKPAECGPLYHALNSLIMYRDRVKPLMTPTDEQPQLAATPDAKTAEDNKVSIPAATADADAGDKPAAALVPEPRLAQMPADTGSQERVDQTEDRFVTIKPVAPETAFSTPQSILSKARSRSDLLTKKAARRLADIVRGTKGGETRVVEEDDRPSLLQAPANGPTRMAIEPGERIIR